MCMMLNGSKTFGEVYYTAVLKMKAKQTIARPKKIECQNFHLLGIVTCWGYRDAHSLFALSKAFSIIHLKVIDFQKIVSNPCLLIFKPFPRSIKTVMWVELLDSFFKPETVEFDIVPCNDELPQLSRESSPAIFDSL